MCGATGVEFQEDPIPGSPESDKKVHWVTQCADNYLLITTKLTLALVEKCEVKNMNSQKYPSNRNQDTQINFISLRVIWP